MFCLEVYSFKPNETWTWASILSLLEDWPSILQCWLQTLLLVQFFVSDRVSCFEGLIWPLSALKQHQEQQCTLSHLNEALRATISVYY